MLSTTSPSPLSLVISISLARLLFKEQRNDRSEPYYSASFWDGNYIRTSWSWNKWGKHQNHTNILSMKHTFTVMLVSWFHFYTCMEYFRMNWPMMMCMWTLLVKNGLCWILHRRVSTKMWCWRTTQTSLL